MGPDGTRRCGAWDGTGRLFGRPAEPWFVRYRRCVQKTREKEASLVNTATQEGMKKKQKKTHHLQQYIQYLYETDRVIMK